MKLRVRMKGELGEVEIETSCERTWNGDYIDRMRDQIIDGAIKQYKAMDTKHEKSI